MFHLLEMTPEGIKNHLKQTISDIRLDIEDFRNDESLTEEQLREEVELLLLSVQFQLAMHKAAYWFVSGVLKDGVNNEL